ncbi:C-14 sterol reductase [Coprinopsis cinerea okayama7|uniref:Delta(14)-sterol reductase ERG24 n=1 Tax=Coprinopsis cinerea (strain Okayama-7 / 130 / ATCC MYA-4618 / FGSC 9003) TaxID=240176 RepID=A8NT48_COPC7|nr:C-14 sterol reductase [Coprinopsis cinerea okayama7\|eukprot:XP_001836156.2 C-14 sterol reductase [Coprinopsis cinerea okayama7\
MASKDNAVLNPKTTSYEFLGPPGATLVSIGVPFMLYALYFGCNETSGGCPPPLATVPERVVAAVSDIEFWKSLYDQEAALIYAAWYAFCVGSWAILPGDWIEGTTLRTGEKKKYKINAFSTFLLAMGITTGWILRNGPESFTFIYTKWVGFVTAALINSFIQAVFVYVMSFRPGRLLALGGNSGNFIYDWFIGRELNPSIGSFDIKSFNELRPGLILWVLINISMVCEQAVRRGGFHNVTDSMWLVLAFETWYVADALYNEPAVFTTMDIVSDGFGFMLSVGDLAWVPFVYTIQARYLAFHPIELGIPATIAIILTNLLGYYIFRDSNGEKNDFRNGKNPKTRNDDAWIDLKWMPTKRGTKLLISGWWGLCQHPNYLGDLIMALAWSLPTGFNTPVTYFYPIYFTILLLHRQNRDDEACHAKYGDDWLEYKKKVPYKIFPYIY